MKSRPILFSGDMVRAILDGRKTQTRRPVRDQPPPGTAFTKCGGPVAIPEPFGSMRMQLCPYGVTGDELWVRETFNTLSPYWCDVLRTGTAGSEEMAQARKFACDYRADRADNLYPFKWTPSIHMPRWASRITLKITNVRVQQLMDASEADIIAEGFTDPTGYQCALMRAYGDGITYANPWVWAVTFEVAP